MESTHDREMLLADGNGSTLAYVRLPRGQRANPGYRRDATASSSAKAKSSTQKLVAYG